MTNAKLLRWTTLVAAGMLVVACAGDNGEENSDSADADGGGVTEWPHDEMTIIVPFDAGGGADTLARDLEPYLEEELDTSITVENHPGAATQVGTTHFMNATPDDGSTLLMLTQMFFSGSVVLQGGDYDISDVSVLNTEVIDPVTVTVQEEGQYENFDDLVENIQANPGEVSWAGIFGAHSHVTGLMIEEELALESRPVFFDGGGEQRNALMGGNTDYMMGTAVGDIAQEDRLRVLAINTDPDAPIFELAPDAEPLNDALARYDAGPVPQLASARSVAVHRSFRTRTQNSLRFSWTRTRPRSTTPSTSPTLNHRGGSKSATGGGPKRARNSSRRCTTRSSTMPTSSKSKAEHSVVEL